MSRSAKIDLQWSRNFRAAESKPFGFTRLINGFLQWSRNFRAAESGPPLSTVTPRLYAFNGAATLGLRKDG